MRFAGVVAFAAGVALASAPVAAHVDPVDHTPLMQAAETGDVPVMERLIAGGAVVNAANQQGTTALMDAARSGHRGAVETLLSHGADVNARDKMGHTALHYASISGNAGIVRALVSAGADVNARDNRGNTPLRVAAGLKRNEAAETLRALGATELPAKPR